MIYLDNAATTPPCTEAVERARAFLEENFYNPSAIYGGAFSVHAALKEARQGVLSRIADPAKFELIFTSGGTESDNHAVFSGARRGNAVTTKGEHAAVFESFNALKGRGVEPRFAPLKCDGSVDEEGLLSLVDEKTSLVSILHVNNETGAVNDILALARAVKRKNPRALFHSDGVQAFGKIPVRLSADIDLYSVSAHKIGGLKGTGALIKRKNLVLPPLVYGGGQEGGQRSGTENVFGIMAFAYAAEKKFATLEEDGKRILALRNLLRERLDGALYTCLSPEVGSPYILSTSARGMRGEVLVRMLWERGVAAGTGSACSSRHRFSRVLMACGYDEPTLDGVLRWSFSPATTKDEILRAADIANEVAATFRGNL